MTRRIVYLDTAGRPHLTAEAAHIVREYRKHWLIRDQSVTLPDALPRVKQ